MARGLLTKLGLGDGCLPNLPPMGNRLSKLWKTEDFWEHFPKFVISFFAASVIMSFVVARPPADHAGVARLADTFKSKAETIEYDADFSSYRVPAQLADKFHIDQGAGVVNVPLGYILSTIVFSSYWSQI